MEGVSHRLHEEALNYIRMHNPEDGSFVFIIENKDHTASMFSKVPRTQTFATSNERIISPRIHPLLLPSDQRITTEIFDEYEYLMYESLRSGNDLTLVLDDNLGKVQGIDRLKQLRMRILKEQSDIAAHFLSRMNVVIATSQSFEDIDLNGIIDAEGMNFKNILFLNQKTAPALAQALNFLGIEINSQFLGMLNNTSLPMYEKLT